MSQDDTQPPPTASKPAAITSMINDLYAKERKYISNQDKDNFVSSALPIFELQRYHNLKTPKQIEILKQEDEYYSVTKVVLNCKEVKQK